MTCVEPIKGVANQKKAVRFAHHTFLLPALMQASLQRSGNKNVPAIAGTFSGLRRERVLNHSPNSLINNYFKVSVLAGLGKVSLQTTISVSLFLYFSAMLR